MEVFILQQVMKAYAARAYTPMNPRRSKYIEVNIPEYTPTLPKDNNNVNISVSGSYFVNNNYPITQGIVTTTHSLSLPLLRATTCPVIFNKGTQFLLFVPTKKIEEGYLLYI